MTTNNLDFKVKNGLQVGTDAVITGSATATSFIGDGSSLTGLPTQASLSVDDLITLSGVSEGSANLGSFTGTTIANNSTVKSAVQQLETSVETKADVGVAAALSIALG